MAENLFLRALKRVVNEIISVSLKAIILAVWASLAAAITVVWIALRGNPHSPWFYGIAGALFSALIVVLILAVLVGLRLWQDGNGDRKEPADQPQGVERETYDAIVLQLSECESQKAEQVKLQEQHRRVANDVEDKLRVAQAKLDGFAVPRRRLRIKRGLYCLPGKTGLDVTEKLEQMALDDKLVLGNTPYQVIFVPDPWPGVRKQLVIEFSHGLEDFSITVPEDTKVTLPFPYGEVV